MVSDPKDVENCLLRPMRSPRTESIDAELCDMIIAAYDAERDRCVAELISKWEWRRTPRERARFDKEQS